MTPVTPGQGAADKVRQPRAVIFDLDGTLADSAPDIAAALNASLEGRGLETLSLAAVKLLVGGGARLLTERALAANGIVGDAIRIDTLLADFLDRYRAEPYVRTQLYPGARDALEQLAARGFALGVATNKPDDLTQAIVDGLGIRTYFGSVIGSVPGLALKPAPEILFKVCAALGAGPAEAIMVGDSAADLGAARAAGMGCILFTHGYSSKPVHTFGAAAVVTGFAELDEALQVFIG